MDTARLKQLEKLGDLEATRELSRIRRRTGLSKPGYCFIPDGQYVTYLTFDNTRYQNRPTIIVVDNPLLMKETPVTQYEWYSLMKNNPSYFKTGRWRLKPVENVTWFDAIAYCNKLSTTQGLRPVYDITGEYGTPGMHNYAFQSVRVNDENGYRLPTEMEFEYACTCGGNAKYDEIGKNAWHEGNSRRTTHESRRKQPNAWGLYDLIGNVWEWCLGRYTKSMKNLFAHIHPAVGCRIDDRMAIFGGAYLTHFHSFDDPDWLCGLTSCHRAATPTNFLGFRVVRKA